MLWRSVSISPVSSHGAENGIEEGGRVSYNGNNSV